MENHIRFHITAKKCKIKEKYLDEKYPQYGKVDYSCQTHNVKICKCGWEIMWHGGEYGPSMDNKTKISMEAMILPINRI